jgi:hypothetical protein
MKETPASADVKEIIRQWHIPLSREQLTLRQAHAELAQYGLKQSDVPLIVQLVENPRYDIPGLDIFHGATGLQAHDHIHVLLGRGLLPKDEAFVIGFTMGSTDQVSQTEEKLYGFFSKYFYPESYRFGDEDYRVFQDAVRLGFVSDCQPLSAADLEALVDLPLAEARRRLGLEVELLRAYYAIEKKRYPNSFESQRLLS